MRQLKNGLVMFVMVLLMAVQPVGDFGVKTTVYAETMVYVTPTGSKYHTHKCGNGNFYQTTLSEAKARGLTPCKKCYGSSGSASSGAGSSSGSAKKTNVSKAKLSLSSTNILLIKGQSKTLKVKGTSGSVKWSSSNKKVAVVSGGKVTAKGKGQATITVSSGGVSKTCKVKVENPKISKSSINLKPGETMVLKLSGCSHDVIWISSNEDVCTVYDGEVEAYEPGKAIIKAKVHGHTFQCKVTVEKPAVSDFSLSQEMAEIDLAETDIQFLYLEDLNEDVLEYYTPEIISSDKNVVEAEIDWSGEIEIFAVGVGEADITVKIGKVSKSCHVTVVDSSIQVAVPEII